MNNPEGRARMKARREAAILRREKLIETARRLLNRAKLRGYDGVPGPGGYGTVFVMRPDTLDFIVHGQSALQGETPEFPMGATPLLDKTPVYFSEDLAPDQIILAWDGWPYFSKADIPEPYDDD
jgi:hypothetical protein